MLQKLFQNADVTTMMDFIKEINFYHLVYFFVVYFTFYIKILVLSVSTA